MDFYKHPLLLLRAKGGAGGEKPKVMAASAWKNPGAAGTRAGRGAGACGAFSGSVGDARRSRAKRREPVLPSTGFTRGCGLRGARASGIASPGSRCLGPGGRWQRGPSLGCTVPRCEAGD